MWVDYEPHPKNKFHLKVNDSDYYTLVKEELDYDPNKVETFSCTLILNEVEALRGIMPWNIDEVEDKINTVYQGKPLESL